jgi:hypothetical protein
MPTQISAPLDLETERAKYFEYLDGQFLERALGTDLHSDCQFNLTRLLKPIAKQANAKVRQEWTLAHGDDWLTPDVMLSKPNDFPVDGRGYLTAPLTSASKSSHPAKANPSSSANAPATIVGEFPTAG